MTVSAQSPTYWQDIRPALRKHCIACHNARNLQEPDVSGGLALDKYDSFMKGAKKPVLVPGKSNDSELIKRMLSTDPDVRMPPGDKRAPPEIVTLVRRWIDAGAAEGTKPDDTPTVVTNPAKRRKLPVSLITNAIPPANILDNGKPDKLTLTLRVGPLAPVTAVAISPDAKTLAVGAYGRVALWDLVSVKPVKTLTNVLGSVNDLRFSPDGAILAVAGGLPSAQGDLRLFDVNGWKLKTVLRGHEDVVASIAFRPDGKKLVSASFDKTARIWDLATLKTDAILEPHTDFIYAAAWSPDGNFLATASKDRTVKLTDANTRQGKLTFSGMSQDVLAVGFNHDGARVLSSGYEAGIYWWDPKTAQREKLQSAHRNAVHEIHVSRDGKTIATAGGDGNVVIWDGISAANLRTIATGSLVYAVTLSPDTRLVAAGCYDGFVRVYETKTGRHLATLLDLAGNGADDWLAQTPEGYTHASQPLRDAAQWTMTNRPIPAAPVWKSLTQPDLLPRALQGQTLPLPAFTK